MICHFTTSNKTISKSYFGQLWIKTINPVRNKNEVYFCIDKLHSAHNKYDKDLDYNNVN